MKVKYSPQLAVHGYIGLIIADTMKDVVKTAVNKHPFEYIHYIFSMLQIAVLRVS